jgi:hypothetical protein
LTVLPSESTRRPGFDGFVEQTGTKDFLLPDE